MVKDLILERNRPTFRLETAEIRSPWLVVRLPEGDIEKASGLLRCHISRLDNGHLVPSSRLWRTSQLLWEFRCSGFCARGMIHLQPQI